MLNQNFLLICVLSNDEHDGAFCIYMRSDKLASRKAGITAIKAIEDCAFLKSQCVLADLCSHTGLEVSFHRVETCMQMNELQGFPSFIQVKFRNLPRGDLLIFSATAWVLNRYHISDYSKWL